ncbi:hypothetical protein HDU96_007232 [Phlyctochytrium bullatum]|nr:hypothetical protein HDU96_007232 [Phlyctochytrium bullatum]
MSAPGPSLATPTSRGPVAVTASSAPNPTTHTSRGPVAVTAPNPSPNTPQSKAPTAAAAELRTGFQAAIKIGRAGRYPNGFEPIKRESDISRELTYALDGLGVTDGFPRWFDNGRLVFKDGFQYNWFAMSLCGQE